ncbi:MAG: type II toxin-antitoxin system prevent-host-death family antitoxin [Acidobacteria bacterium]|nr:type II toxin-antitoxin system prevent-host-death family antitoxin [Acidobacteriota bacterium]
MSVSRFKEQCLSLVDTLDPEGLVITKRGKPVAKVFPINSECSSLIGSLKGTLRIHRALGSTGLKWDAES